MARPEAGLAHGRRRRRRPRRGARARAGRPPPARARHRARTPRRALPPARRAPARRATRGRGPARTAAGARDRGRALPCPVHGPDQPDRRRAEEPRVNEERQYCYPFPRPMLTADVACIADEGGRTYLLLIE